MADAKLQVKFAGPLITFQDAGRPGHLRYGVCASGPMDRLAYQAANAALGNPPGLTTIEISLGGLMLLCREGEVTLAITGGDFLVEHAGQKGTSWTVLTLGEGETLNIRPGQAGSWAYLAFSGDLKAERWLGHSATHASSGFGGGALQSGQILTVLDCTVRSDREGDISRPDQSLEDPVRVVIGPQEQCFDVTAIETLTTTPFTVTDAYDRMGMRLSGPPLALEGALSIPSEPILRGSIQVSGDGVPTILLADHQTTGGYPKIATVISCDVDRLVQARAGQSLRFLAITPEDAITVVRDDFNMRRTYLDRISVIRGTLEQRLMRENLIHGEFRD